MKVSKAGYVRFGDELLDNTMELYVPCSQPVFDYITKEEAMHLICHLVNVFGFDFNQSLPDMFAEHLAEEDFAKTFKETDNSTEGF